MLSTPQRVQDYIRKMLLTQPPIVAVRPVNPKRRGWLATVYNPTNVTLGVLLDVKSLLENTERKYCTDFENGHLHRNPRFGDFDLRAPQWLGAFIIESSIGPEC